MQPKQALIVLLVASLFGCATIVSEQEVRLASMHRRLAEAKLQKGALEFAIREYRAAIAINPEDAENHFGMAEAYRRKGLLEEAETSLHEALRLDPTHPDARLNLSVVYLQQERWLEAIAETTLLIDDPTFLRPSRALVNRAWARYRLGELDAARTDLTEALLSDNGNYQAHLNLGLVLTEQGDVLDAMLHFERVLKLLERRPPRQFGGAEAQARFHLAQAHVKLGQREKAVAHLRLAAERGGKGEWGRKSEEYLSLLQ
jgi:tetratricopeptide (TPR) repeat protein